MNGVKERRRQPIYDSYEFSAGTVSAGTTISFFTTPKSATKPLNLTNLTVAGQIPYNMAWILGLRFYIFTLNATAPTLGDVNQILHNCTISWKKEDRTLLEVPAFMIPAGMGLVPFADASASAFSTANNGTPIKSNYFEILRWEKFEKRDRLQLDAQVQSAMTIANNTYITVILESVIDLKYY